jgi:hypothetical protein
VTGREQVAYGAADPDLLLDAISLHPSPGRRRRRLDGGARHRAMTLRSTFAKRSSSSSVVT